MFHRITQQTQQKSANNPPTVTPKGHLRAMRVLRALGLCLFGVPLSGFGLDDGSQMSSPFRVNYAGYLTEANKTAMYLANYSGPIEWHLVGSHCRGIENTYIQNDFSSGDSFYRIDFSRCTQNGENWVLQVGEHRSPPFSISNDPYGGLVFEVFDYFRDHTGKATFNQTIDNWAPEFSTEFEYVKDAGDNGVYPVNTAEAAWSLINLLETYPQINAYYSSHLLGANTVYQQLEVLTEQFYHVFDHGGPLAIPKFHTNVNDSWALCPPHTSGTCVAKPETKATYSTARALAGMARLRAQYNTQKAAKQAYELASTAFENAQETPLTCLKESDFGGEGGMYPNNDNYAIYRDPPNERDPCHIDKDNTEDDEYAALAELYVTAVVLKQRRDIRSLKKALKSHPRYQEISSFWWGAVAAEGSLTLLAHEEALDLDLSKLKANLLQKANAIVLNQSVGYPGVTWEAQSTQWHNGDQDHLDANVRWGSHRMALNDARLLMAASELSHRQKQPLLAAHYARQALLVLDHIAGINPVALAMFTAKGYPEIENAVTRTHDGADPKDQWPGKMVLGPNNWTNANDPDMPKFGSQPGLKMFALTGVGWASREISIDANAAITPVMYFAKEIAPGRLARWPLSANH